MLARRYPAITVATAFLLVGCGVPAPEAACEEVVAAFADWLLRCDPGADRALTWEAAERYATGGLGCRATVSIRDERALRDECLPAFPSLACEAATLPAACEDQLVLE